MKLSTLKKSAQSSTKWRGHSMRWQQHDATNLTAECRHCGCFVAVNSKPPPNGIEIGGDAVALTCGHSYTHGGQSC